MFKTTLWQEIVLQLKADIHEHLYCDYLLEDGRVVYGNSTSQVRSLVRDMNLSGRRWKNLGGDSRFEQLCEKVGFKVLRGRGRRIFAGGKLAWGVWCDVITECHQVPCYIDPQDMGHCGLYYSEDELGCIAENEL